MMIEKAIYDIETGFLITERSKLFDANSINDESIRRKLEILSQIGTSILEDNDLEKYNGLTNEMSKIYRSVHVFTQKF